MLPSRPPTASFIEGNYTCPSHEPAGVREVSLIAPRPVAYRPSDGAERILATGSREGEVTDESPLQKAEAATCCRCCDDRCRRDERRRRRSPACGSVGARGKCQPVRSWDDHRRQPLLRRKCHVHGTDSGISRRADRHVPERSVSERPDGELSRPISRGVVQDGPSHL